MFATVNFRRTTAELSEIENLKKERSETCEWNADANKTNNDTDGSAMDSQV